MMLDIGGTLIYFSLHNMSFQNQFQFLSIDVFFNIFVIFSFLVQVPTPKETDCGFILIAVKQLRT